MQKMRALPQLFVLFAAILFAAPAAFAQKEDPRNCLVKVGSAWGEVCDRCEAYKGFRRDWSGTFKVELRNDCSETVELKVAMQEEGGSWRTFPIRVLEPGESTWAFACKGTGKYQYWVRKANDLEIVLPSDAEIATAGGR